MSLWKLLTARWGSGAGETDEVRIDASTNSLQIIEYEHHEIHGNSHYFLEGTTALGNGTVIDFCITVDSGTAAPHVVFSYESELDLSFALYDCADFDADGTLAVQFGNNRAECHCGSHTAAGNNATVMTDAAASFTVDALIGWRICNITDGSYGIVTDNDGTTVTVAALVGGTDNDWDTSDQYEINRSLTIITTDATVNSVGILIASSTGGSGTNPNKGVPGGAKRSNELILKPGNQYIWRFTSNAASNALAYNAEWYEHTPKH